MMEETPENGREGEGACAAEAKRRVIAAFQSTTTRFLRQEALFYDVPRSGTKAQLIERILRTVFAGSEALPDFVMPTEGQLVYIAAAARRQGMTPPLAVLRSKQEAMAWLSRHGDWRG